MIRLFLLLLATDLMWTGGEYTDPHHFFRLTLPPGYRVVSGTKEVLANDGAAACQTDLAVCFEYPAMRFKGSTFNSASIEVTRLEARNEKACIDPARQMISQDGYGDDQIDTSQPLKVVAIDGTKFRHTRRGGAAAGTSSEFDRYLGFDNGNCFDLVTRISFGTFANYPPGTIQEFTRNDRAKVETELGRIVMSFRAVK